MGWTDRSGGSPLHLGLVTLRDQVLLPTDPDCCVLSILEISVWMPPGGGVVVRVEAAVGGGGGKLASSA